MAGQREKSQKYFDLSIFDQNLNDSNPWSSLVAMNFQKWELFPGSPGMDIQKSYTTSISKQILKIFSPMAMNVQWIFLTHI